MNQFPNFKKVNKQKRIFKSERKIMLTASSDQNNLRKPYKKPTITVKSHWSAPKNRFQKNGIFEKKEYLDRDQFVNLIKTVKILNSRSGAKKRSCTLVTLMLVVCSLLAYSAGFYLILKGLTQYAGAVLTLCPIAIFFFVIGPGMINGDQYERLNSFIADDECEVHDLLRNAGFKISNSISRRDIDADGGSKLRTRLKKIVVRWELAGYIEFIPIGEDERSRIPFELRELGGLDDQSDFRFRMKNSNITMSRNGRETTKKINGVL